MPRKDAFRKAMESYLEEVRQTKRHSTYVTYTKSLRCLYRAVRESGVTTNIKRWTMAEIATVLAKRGHVLPNTFRFEVTVLRLMLLHAGVTVLDAAVRKGRYRLPPRSRVNVRWYGEETLAAIRAACKSDAEYLVVILASDLALRRGEIARLRVTDIQGNNMVVRGKGEKLMPIPLPQCVASDIERWFAVRRHIVLKALQKNPTATVPEELLIHERGGTLRPYAASTVRKMVATVGQRVGIRLCPHDLRRSCGTEVYRASRDLVAVQRLLRHASPTQTQEYLDINLEDARAAMEIRMRHRSSKVQVIAPKPREPVIE